jgi:hypothetical protein
MKSKKLNLKGVNMKKSKFDLFFQIFIAFSLLSFLYLPVSAKENIIIKPNGGEIFYVGWQQYIFWQKNIRANEVNISYSLDGGASWHKIVKDYPNRGSYLWTVPNVVSNNCRVKIEWKEDLGNIILTKVYTSDGVFTITNPPKVEVRIIRPNGGERISSGTNAGIKWEVKVDNNPCYEGTSDIYYSIDNGRTWNLIARRLSINPGVGVGAYTWQVPHVDSDRCKLKVEWFWVRQWRDDALTGRDETDRTFTITTR